ncbi:MAG: hypothetical protein UR98_C0040G0023 [Parcubacteria group bacterium GW2011_GWA1_36_12]|nr:MAG: hypothetical protein UR98_C0040G0023 [Parcubacteria group bacterium GW2011_GWA1_36_12]
MAIERYISIEKSQSMLYNPDSKRFMRYMNSGNSGRTMIIDAGVAEDLQTLIDSGKFGSRQITCLDVKDFDDKETF